MKYYRVWAQCCRRPKGMAVQKIDEKIATDEIFESIFGYDGKITDELEMAFEEDDQERINKEYDRLYEKAMSIFKKVGSWGCGDYQIEMVEDDEDSPSRPNICGYNTSVYLAED